MPVFTNILPLLRQRLTERPHGQPTVTRQDETYELFRAKGDPHEQFDIAEKYRHAIQEMLASQQAQAASELAEALEEQYAIQLSHLVFSSNLIESAGSKSLEVTLKVGRQVFAGDRVDELLRHEVYEVLRKELSSTENAPDEAAVVQRYTEIVQHCRALVHIIDEFVIRDQLLSEYLIHQTHGILTDGIDTADGIESAAYSGVYRQHEVSAGLSTFTRPDRVSREMERFIEDLNTELQDASASATFDPYVIAAKASHIFVNIHPYADGNGRTCRLLLNAILLKYTGICIDIGGDEAAVNEYLEVASSSNLHHPGYDEDESQFSKPPWAQLSSLTVRYAADAQKSLFKNVYRAIHGEEYDDESGEEAGGNEESEEEGDV